MYKDGEFVIKDRSLNDLDWLIHEKNSSFASLVDQILYNRNYRSEEDLELFKSPSYEKHLHDPLLLTDMEKAVDFTVAAIEAEKTILVFGDYDADGVTSTALLYSFLKKVKAKCDYHIPHRINDGYGITVEGVRLAKEKEVDLIITVDNGIVANEAIDEANHLGIDVIITDHHKAGERLPNALAIVNPNRMDCNYPFKGISGVGVAFKFISVLADKLMRPAEKEKFLRWNLDLVAMGTVADVMPLLDENRVLVYFGLKVISKSRRMGIQALLQANHGKTNSAEASVIGFQLGPRINAAGRLEAADKALKLLITEDRQEADRLALELNEINLKRQKLTEKAVKEAEQKITEKADLIILDSEHWHQGIIGLIASRLCEAHFRPVLIFNYDREKKLYKASGRSPFFFDISKMILSAKELLLAGGGHRQACGCTVLEQDFPLFKERMFSYVKAHLSEEINQDISIEAELSASDLNLQKLAEINKLQPFGQAFSEPVFYARNMIVRNLRRVGFENKHLSMSLEQNGELWKSIAFKMGHLADFLRNGLEVDIAFYLSKNNWQGTSSVQLVIKDIRI